MPVNTEAVLMIFVHSTMIALCVHWITTGAVHHPVGLIFLAIVNAVGIALHIFTITE
jgi:hypothetical protein